MEKMGDAWIVELTRADSICESLEASAPIYGFESQSASDGYLKC